MTSQTHPLGWTSTGAPRSEPPRFPRYLTRRRANRIVKTIGLERYCGSIWFSLSILDRLQTLASGTVMCGSADESCDLRLQDRLRACRAWFAASTIHGI